MATVDIRVLLADDVNPDDVARGVVAGSLDGTTVLAATVLVKDEWWDGVAAISGAPHVCLVPSTIYTRGATVWDGDGTR